MLSVLERLQLVAAVGELRRSLMTKSHALEKGAVCF
jgi:hypothetical protein